MTGSSRGRRFARPLEPEEMLAVQDLLDPAVRECSGACSIPESDVAPCGVCRRAIAARRLFATLESERKARQDPPLEAQAREAVEAALRAACVESSILATAWASIPTAEELRAVVKDPYRAAMDASPRELLRRLALTALVQKKAAAHLDEMMLRLPFDGGGYPDPTDGTFGIDPWGVLTDFRRAFGLKPTMSAEEYVADAARSREGGEDG